MKIKAGEVESIVKNTMDRYLSGGEIEQNEFEYIKRYSRYLKTINLSRGREEKSK